MTLNDGKEVPVRMGTPTFLIFLSFVLAAQTCKNDPVINVFEPKIRETSIKKMFPKIDDPSRVPRTVQYVKDAFNKAIIKAGYPKLDIRIIENVKVENDSGCYRLIPALKKRIKAQNLKAYLKSKTDRDPAEDDAWTLYRIAGKLLI